MNTYHTSVLLHETIEFLQVKKGKKYIDGTLGGGGHTAAILERGGKVLGIDFDEDALAFAKENYQLPMANDQLVVVKGNFKDIDGIAKGHGFEEVSGILLDIGVSSHHFDTAERGFSFQNEGPLDMRMDRDLQVNASDLVNVLTKGELYELFTKLGEERFAHPISNSIIKARQVKAIKTTGELAEIINRVVPKFKTETNPATRVFQALRIVVNDELNNLKEALPKAIELLEPKGRLAVITFHSLEDRIVKHAFKEFAETGLGEVIIKKPVVPSEAEVSANKRSRSSKLRVFEKS